MATEPLLEQLWQRKAEGESGEMKENKAVDLYFTLKEKADKNPELRSLTDELEYRIGDYADAVIRRSQTRANQLDREDIQSSDENEKRIHDALIATVNQLARFYHKLKLNNSWRTDIIGLDRESVGSWALTIARDVLGKKID